MTGNAQPLSAWLESSAGQRTPIGASCVLGRAPTSQVVLPDERVSRRHAMIHLQGQNEYWLIDLGSSNGTYLNTRRVSQPCKLADGDLLRIADFLFTFRDPKAPVAPASASAGSEKTIQEIKTLDCWLLVGDIECSTLFISKQPPQEAPRVTGRWLADCKQIIDEHQGVINKFLGDGFFAYWRDQPNIAGSVIRALMALRQLQEAGQPRFRVVLHYGKVYAGGAATMGEESLLGAEVNFAFRMEKLAASLGLRSLLSEAAHTRVQAFLPTHLEGQHPLSGFEGEYPFYSY